MNVSTGNLIGYIGGKFEKTRCRQEFPSSNLSIYLAYAVSDPSVWLPVFIDRHRDTYVTVSQTCLPSILYMGERSQRTDKKSLSTAPRSLISSACTARIRSSSRFASSTSRSRCVLSPFMFSSCFDARDSLAARCSITRSFSTSTSFCKSST